MGAHDHAERSATDLLMMDGLKLLRAFLTITDAADRRKVIELATALATPAQTKTAATG